MLSTCEVELIEMVKGWLREMQPDTVMKGVDVLVRRLPAGISTLGVSMVKLPFKTRGEPMTMVPVEEVVPMVEVDMLPVQYHAPFRHVHEEFPKGGAPWQTKAAVVGGVRGAGIGTGVALGVMVMGTGVGTGEAMGVGAGSTGASCTSIATM